MRDEAYPYLCASRNGTQMSIADPNGSLVGGSS